MRRVLACIGIVGFAVAAAALPAAAATITVAPTSVTVSGPVTVSGDVLTNGTRGCAVGDDVTLISNAFAGISEFAGVGAVMLPVDASGHFRAVVTIKPSVPIGTYTITGRCGGGNLGVEATLTVTGLPRTGASFGPLSITDVIATGAALVVFGALLLRAARRRDPAGSSAPTTGA